MTDKELDEMIAEANCDKDGHIDYEGTNYPKWFIKSSKLYIPSTLNIDFILWHPQLIVDAVKY